MKYEKLKKFHEDHYHPSNSTFITYGDLDFTKHLEYVDRHVLTHFERKDIDPKMEPEPRLEQPKYKVEYFMPELINEPESQGKIGISYLCNEVNKDSYETFCL